MELYLEIVEYESNNTKAVFINSLESYEDSSCLETFLEITTNHEDAEKYLGADEILVKTWSENEPFVKSLLSSGFFEDTGRRIEVSQWCEAAIWKLTNISNSSQGL